MFNQVNGLPAHILLVHAVVVLVPISATLVVLSATWPAARRRLGLITPGTTLVTFLSIPLTTQAGEWLQHRVPDSAAVRTHASMGDGIVPFGFALLLLAVVGWWWGRRQEKGITPAMVRSQGPGSQATPGASRLGAAVAPAIVVLSVLVSVGAVVQVIRIGDSGAQASWQGKVSAAPHDVPGGDR
jgi:hypothetical protein